MKIVTRIIINEFFKNFLLLVRKLAVIRKMTRERKYEYHKVAVWATEDAKTVATAK